MSATDPTPIEAAVEHHMQLEAPGAVVTEWVLVAAGQKFDADGTTTFATTVLHSDGTPSHRILGLLVNATTRYQVAGLGIEWQPNDDEDDQL